MRERLRVLMVGVGGQGVLTASQILGQAAKVAGLEVMMGQLHGMSQRGGSVESSVLIGPGHSAFIGEGEADIVVALEPLEGLRARPKMARTTKVLLNDRPITPFAATRSGQIYPELEEIRTELQAATPHLVVVDGSGTASAAGIPQTLNMVMLGTVSALGLLPFGEAVLLETIDRYCPRPLVEANRRALALGIALYHRTVEGATGSERGTNQEQRDELQDRH